MEKYSYSILSLQWGQQLITEMFLKRVFKSGANPALPPEAPVHSPETLLASLEKRQVSLSSIHPSIIPPLPLRRSKFIITNSETLRESLLKAADSINKEKMLHEIVSDARRLFKLN